MGYYAYPLNHKQDNQPFFYTYEILLYSTLLSIRLAKQLRF